MHSLWITSVGRQMGSALDMLENAIRDCPEGLWAARLWTVKGAPAELAEYWYLAFHTLFWLDLYLTGQAEGFAPPAPFTLDELDPAGRLPERRYTPAELLAYLEHGRRKCRARLEALKEAEAQQRCRFPWGELPYAELLLDNMRHVQDHAAQLSLFLGQSTGHSGRWVARPKG